MLQIHAPQPLLEPIHNREFPGLRTALGTVLAPAGEGMTWIWNRVPVRVGYRTPFSDAFVDVLFFVEALLGPARSGHHSSRFCEYALTADWNLAWHDGQLVVDSAWYKVLGADETLLRQRSRLEMPVPDFLAEWKMPLRRLVDALDLTRSSCPDDQAKVDRLRRIEAALPHFGAAYRADASARSDSRAP